MLNKDSFRTGTSNTPLCDCGKADESVEYFLLNCENYTEARKVMLDTTEDLVSTSKYRHSLRITEDLLLAPTYQDGIRKSDMSLIKEALFDFISSCDRKMAIYFGINQAVNYFKLAYICDFMTVSTSGFTYESLLGCNLARCSRPVSSKKS